MNEIVIHCCLTESYLIVLIEISVKFVAHYGVIIIIFVFNNNILNLKTNREYSINVRALNLITSQVEISFR